MPDIRMSEDSKLVEMWTQMGQQTGGLIGRSIGLTSYGFVSIMAGLLAPAVLLNSVILDRNRRLS